MELLSRVCIKWVSLVDVEAFQNSMQEKARNIGRRQKPKSCDYRFWRTLGTAGNYERAFEAYEDILVETSSENVPPPVGTFAKTDLGETLNLNIKLSNYVKPTPVQRYAIPISLAGRDLMACAQTGSGRSSFPLALILSPTRELSMQAKLLGYIFMPIYTSVARYKTIYLASAFGEERGF
ncbi:hypothetical protein SUGI_0760670 [Cryptomeria japonica]|nr:hypothetical protein SUGI_0760670 [Cryptomeria japonica]